YDEADGNIRRNEQDIRSIHVIRNERLDHRNNVLDDILARGSHPRFGQVTRIAIRSSGDTVDRVVGTKNSSAIKDQGLNSLSHLAGSKSSLSHIKRLTLVARSSQGTKVDVEVLMNDRDRHAIQVIHNTFILALGEAGHRDDGPFHIRDLLPLESSVSKSIGQREGETATHKILGDNQILTGNLNYFSVQKDPFILL